MTQAIVPQELSTPRKMTDKLFNLFDLNRDGWISYEEFYQGASKDPVILQLLECDPFGSDSPTTPSKSKLFKF